jgi:hypothetical protein
MGCDTSRDARVCMNGARHNPQATPHSRVAYSKPHLTLCVPFYQLYIVHLPGTHEAVLANFAGERAQNTSSFSNEELDPDRRLAVCSLFVIYLQNLSFSTPNRMPYKLSDRSDPCVTPTKSCRLRSFAAAWPSHSLIVASLGPFSLNGIIITTTSETAKYFKRDFTFSR